MDQAAPRAVSECGTGESPVIEFAFPWLLAIFPAPFLLARLTPGYRSIRGSVRIPQLDRFVQLTGSKPAEGAVIMKRTLASWVVLATCWAAILIAVARPQYIGDPIFRTQPSRDMILAVDLSGSMDTEDFTDADGNQVSRLVACKQVLDDFLSRREGDRVGLILFGSAAFVQAPFTEDLQLCRQLLDEAQVGMAGPQTAMGDAVGLALTLFERSEQEDRVLIVLTDGNDTTSKVTPVEAAKIGRDKGVTIHTIAVGDPEAVGEEKIDEDVLKQMSDLTGGDFFRADDREQLEGIYSRLDRLETRDLESESYSPRIELFHWPLSVFLLIGLAYHGYFVIRHLIITNRISSRLTAATSILIVTVNCGSVSPMPTGTIGFHFIRPFWLLALIPICVIVVVALKRRDSSQGLKGMIEPHLLKHLAVQPSAEGTFQPVHFLAIGWSLAAIGLAGPTWQREPSPFADDQAAVIFVQEVSPTMMAQDIQPSRLQRSVHKIRDFFETQPGTDSALIAYSGSAHLVMPLTGDNQIIESFASELSPRIMPLEGDAAADAIEMANAQLKGAGRPGSIILITDGVDESQAKLMAKRQGYPVHVLAIAGEQDTPLPPDSPPAPALDETALKQFANSTGATLTIVTHDDSDIQSLSRKVTTSFVAAVEEEGGERWRDMGYWLTPLVALIACIWFRPGWMINWE